MLKQVGWALTLIAVGCNGGTVDTSGATSASPLTSKMPTLPWGSGTGAQSPWGGSNAARWRPEAIMANAMSQVP